MSLEYWKDYICNNKEIFDNIAFNLILKLNKAILSKISIITDIFYIFILYFLCLFDYGTNCSDVCILSLTVRTSSHRIFLNQIIFSAPASETHIVMKCNASLAKSIIFLENLPFLSTLDLVDIYSNKIDYQCCIIV